MIEKIARRAGGFASTTALRWIGAGRDALPEPLAPDHKSSGGITGKVTSAAVTGAVVILSSDKVRSGIESGLRAVSRTLRTEPAPRPKRPTAAAHSNGNGNGNGSKSLTEKTKAELYELAKKAGLPGRSSMSKEDLAKALTS